MLDSVDHIEVIWSLLITVMNSKLYEGRGYFIYLFFMEQNLN